MEQRLPWLMLATALWTLAIGLTYITCQTKDLGAAMCAAIAGQAACTVFALVVAECVMRKTLAHHREEVGKMVALERVRVEDIARAAAASALAEVRELRPR